jgi:hypothetical protein
VCLDSIPALDSKDGSAPECLLPDDYVPTSNGAFRLEVPPADWWIGSLGHQNELYEASNLLGLGRRIWQVIYFSLTDDI